MARVEIVVGADALDAALTAGTNLVTMEEIGGVQSFRSSSYNSGNIVPGGFLRPDSDVAGGSAWGSSPVASLSLFSQLDEVVSDGASTEITSSGVSSVTSLLRSFDIGLGGANPLDRHKAITVTAIVAKSGSFVADTGSLNDSTASFTLNAVEGSTIRATRTFSDIGTEFAAVSFDMTEAERFSVGDWTDISVSASFDLSVSTGSSAVNGRCTQVEVCFEGGVKIFEAPPFDDRHFRLTWET